MTWLTSPLHCQSKLNLRAEERMTETRRENMNTKCYWMWPTRPFSRGEQNKKHSNKINTNSEIPVAWVLPGYMSLKKRVSKRETEEKKSGYIKNVIILLTFNHDYNTLMWQMWQVFTSVPSVHWTVKQQVFFVFYFITAEWTRVLFSICIAKLTCIYWGNAHSESC